MFEGRDESESDWLYFFSCGWLSIVFPNSPPRTVMFATWPTNRNVSARRFSNRTSCEPVVPGSLFSTTIRVVTVMLRKARYDAPSSWILLTVTAAPEAGWNVTELDVFDESLVMICVG